MARNQYRFLTDNITTDRDALPPNVRLSYQTDSVGPLLAYDPESLVSPQPAEEKPKRRQNHIVSQSQSISPSLFATLPVAQTTPRPLPLGGPTPLNYLRQLHKHSHCRY